MKPLAYQNLTENLEANFRDLSKFEKKLAEQKTWANFAEMPNFIEPENLLKIKTLICKTQNANL